MYLSSSLRLCENFLTAAPILPRPVHGMLAGKPFGPASQLDKAALVSQRDWPGRGWGQGTARPEGHDNSKLLPARSKG